MLIIPNIDPLAQFAIVREERRQLLELDKDTGTTVAEDAAAEEELKEEPNGDDGTSG